MTKKKILTFINNIKIKDLPKKMLQENGSCRLPPM